MANVAASAVNFVNELVSFIGSKNSRQRECARTATLQQLPKMPGEIPRIVFHK